MVNEFRKDLVSGEWVLVASGRAKRPHDGERKRLYQTSEECVFEPTRMSEQLPPVAVYDHGKSVDWRGDWDSDWTTVIVPNKFPALQPGVCGAPERTGPFETYPALGFHELVITRDHDRHFAQFSTDETAEVLRAYRDRYRTISTQECGAYISIFHNHGQEAGASVYHNHSQIISTPIVPPEVRRSVEGANRYFQKHGVGVHRMLIDWELAERTRIVYENDLFVAFCPFVSKAYELRVFPKKQDPCFQCMSDAELTACADALGTVLKKLDHALGDPDYNFYIHTAPIAKDPAMEYAAYHWHLEIVPRLPWAPAAGLELSTAIYINPYDPDGSAEHLRETKR